MSLFPEKIASNNSVQVFFYLVDLLNGNDVQEYLSSFSSYSSWDTPARLNKQIFQRLSCSSASLRSESQLAPHLRCELQWKSVCHYISFGAVDSKVSFQFYTLPISF